MQQETGQQKPRWKFWGKNKIKGKDGALMVLIPAGDFQMGSNDYDNEKPIHTVYLDAFYIDIYDEQAMGVSC